MAHLDPDRVEDMPVDVLLGRADSWRRVQSRIRLDDFHATLAATRGDAAGVRAVHNHLQRAAGLAPAAKASGDVNDLMRWLGGA